MAMERFHFETSTGEKIDVPFFEDSFTRKEMKKLNKDLRRAEAEGDADEAAQEESLIVAASKKNGYPKDFVELVDNLTMRDYKNFFRGWSEQDGASLGES